MNPYNIDIPYLDKIAEEEGFEHDNLEKFLRLSEILRFFSQNSFLNEYLALKGGLAINLTAFRMSRLSLDLDWNFAYACSREEMMSAREKINNEIRAYLAREGYTPSLAVRPPRRSSLISKILALLKMQKASTEIPLLVDFWRLDYINASGIPDYAEIQINYSDMYQVLPIVDSAVLLDYLGDITLKTLSPIEMFASKICALLYRASVRDIFDVYRMITANLFDSDEEKRLLRKSLVFYLAANTCRKAEDVTLDFGRFMMIEKLSFQQVQTELLPLLRKSDNFDLEKAKDVVIRFLNGFLVFSEEELNFIKCFNNRDYRPDILFPEGNIADGLKRHPVALWRCGLS